MRFFEKLHGILSKPNEFFAKLKKEKGIKESFVYYLIFAVIISAIAMAYMYLLSGIDKDYALIRPSMPILLPFFFIIMLGISIAGTFISSGIVHLFVLLLKGKHGFSETFKALIYSDTPRFLFAIVFLPIYAAVMLQIRAGGYVLQEIAISIIAFIIGLPIIIWSIYLSVIGVAKLQDISKFRAFTAVFLIPFAIAILVILFFVIGMMIIAGILGSGLSPAPRVII